MELRQLQYVDAVARLGNFTRAAEELNVAQPGLSVAVRNLEAELGLRLFERTRPVTLTDAGEAFVAHARRILDDIVVLGDEMADFVGALRGRVRMSVWYHLDPDMPEILHAFLDHHPQIEFSIVDLTVPDMLDAVRRGSIDFCVPILTQAADLTDIETATIRTEEIAAAIPLDHPLAGAASVSLRDLASVPLIAPAADTAWRELIDAAFGQAGVRPQIAVETNEVAAALTYSTIGIGVSLWTRRIIEAHGRPVAIIPVAGLSSFVLALAWSRRRHRGPAAEAALAFARTRLAEQVDQAGPGEPSHPVRDR